MEYSKLGSIIYEKRKYGPAYLRSRIDMIKENLAALMAYKESFNRNIIGVAVCRDEKLICLMIALIECNITFLPIDRNLPEHRIRYMLQNANVRDVVVAAKGDSLKFGQCRCIEIQELLQKKEENKLPQCSIDYLNPVYVLYTSGSTGKPKGVAVTYKGFENFIRAIPGVVPLEEDKKIACFTTFVFDIFFLEAVLGLVCGMTVVLADESEQNNPAAMIRLIRDNQVNVLQMTPSRMRLLLLYMNGEYSLLNSVESFLLGGEALTQDLFDELRKNTKAHIYNMYGPTETTIWSLVSDLSNKEKVDIGKPVLNTNVYLVDEKMNIISDGTEGEILIGGAGVAYGYVNNEELTNQSFGYPEFAPQDRVYHTGDLARYDARGNLIYIGRKDSQVKIRGYRIELEEIEMAVNDVDGVNASLVCADGDRLICFYVFDPCGIRKMDADASAGIITCRNKQAGTISDDIIRAHLKNVLPEYMIPSAFVECESFIYTISGKADRKEMLHWYHETMQGQSAEIREYDEVTAKILELFVEEFMDNGMKRNIISNTTLKSIGVHSMNYIRAVVEIENYFDIEFDEEKLKPDCFEMVSDVVEYVKGLMEKNQN